MAGEVSDGQLDSAQGVCANWSTPARTGSGRPTRSCVFSSLSEKLPGRHRHRSRQAFLAGFRFDFLKQMLPRQSKTLPRIWRICRRIGRFRELRLRIEGRPARSAAGFSITGFPRFRQRGEICRLSGQSAATSRPLADAFDELRQGAGAGAGGRPARGARSILPISSGRWMPCIWASCFWDVRLDTLIVNKAYRETLQDPGGRRDRRRPRSAFLMETQPPQRHLWRYRRTANGSANLATRHRRDPCRLRRGARVWPMPTAENDDVLGNGRCQGANGC